MRRRHRGLAFIVALALAFLYVPLIVVVIDSFNSNSTLVKWSGFTLHWFSQAFSSGRVRGDLWTSVEIALLSTVLSVAIGVTAALWARRVNRFGRRTLDAATYMRIVLPEVVIALGLLVLFSRTGFGLGFWAVVAGHVVFNSAYATIVIQARVATMTTVLEEAATDLGATPFRTFRRVTVPMIAPAVLVAALLCFTFSIDNLITSQFLSGTSVETLPMLLFGLVRFNITPEVNAIATGLMVITVTLFGLAALALRVRSRTPRIRDSRA